MTLAPLRPGAPASSSPVQPAPLHDGTVEALPDAVTVPGYDRSQLEPAVVHIGVGGFHRAHQAVYFDELARTGVSTDWGITGVGLRRPQMGEVLGDQDHLYTLVVRGPEGDDVRVIGSVIRYLFAPDDPGAVLEALTDPRTRLVTLTITGTAYPTGDLDAQDPDVRADIETPGTPGTAFGFLVEALHRRRSAGLAGFTVLSCDNAQHNGDLAKGAVLATARLRDVGLADWIEEHVTFPSSMVDRITPETTPEGRDAIAQEHGVDDRWPVITEPFSQWIVEDRFCAGRPPLHEVGVQFVDDVRPYETMKTRMLNGAHSALGHLASLAGFSTTAEAMADPTIRGYVRGYLREVAAGLLEVPGVDLGEYAETLVQRFSNPEISDELTRLCRRSSTKVPAYVLPSVQVAVDHGAPRGHLVLAVAAWMRYLRGTDDEGRALEVTDALADELRALAELGGTDPHPLLNRSDLFGGLVASSQLASELETALTTLEDGALAAAAALQQDPAGTPDVDASAGGRAA